MTQASNPARSIPTRRISFDESLADLPEHFAYDGDLIMSHVVATLSSVFPEGEDFFVRSVRHYRDQITDPELRRQVSGFIGQEAIHGREHRALNDRLDALGYPTKRVERFTKWGLAKREQHLPAISNLAATAALEHFTATLAEVVLRDPEARKLFGSPEVTNMLLWHALEESEHKAVAFDVYRAVGGSERVRTFTMNLTCVGFIGGMTLQAIISLLGDRSTYRPRTLARSVKRLRTSPFLRKEVWRQLRDYNRADFHPDDQDTTDLVAQWRVELFGDEGTLTELLTAKAATAGATAEADATAAA
jgi:predicted metal-dependent hydrolase